MQIDNRTSTLRNVDAFADTFKFGSDFPKPALSHEEMWYRLKGYVAEQVMKRKTPQAVFNLREYMAELEATRTKPFREYIDARKNAD